MWVCVCVSPFYHVPFLLLSFPLVMGKGLWQRKGIPGPGLGRTERYIQSNVEFEKGVCAKKELGIFRSSASSVYDGDVGLCCIWYWSVWMCVRAWNYTEKCVLRLYCTLSIRQLLFQYQPLSCCGGRCGMEEQSSCPGWGVRVVFWLGPPPVGPHCCNITDGGSTGLPINFSSSKHSHLYFPHCWSLTSALCHA